MSIADRWRGFVALLDTREPATALATLRIVGGLGAMWMIAEVLPGGLIDLIWVDRDHGGFRSLGDGPWLVSALGGPTPEVVHGLAAATLLTGLLLTLGLLPRLMALLTLQGVLGLAWLNGHTGGSYDPLASNVLWLLVLADSGATAGLSCRLRTGAWTSDRAVPAWPRYLGIVQLVLMYGSTGLQKLSVHWVPGGDLAALYYILQQPTWRRWDMSWVAQVYPLTQAATLSVWCFEVLAPLLLIVYWFRLTRGCSLRWDPRVFFAMFGLGMHLAIAVTMSVGVFGWMSSALYLCLWHPDEWAALGRRLRRARTWREPSASSASAWVTRALGHPPDR